MSFAGDDQDGGGDRSWLRRNVAAADVALLDEVMRQPRVEDGGIVGELALAAAPAAQVVGAVLQRRRVAHRERRAADRRAPPRSRSAP